MSKEKYGAKECIEVIKANGVYNPNIQKYFEELEELLTEYEAIKNSNPSEALEKLEEIINYYNEPQYDVCETSYPNEFKEMWGKELNIIKQALLKVQEPKHYLKWEDLDFKEETTYENVKMGEHIYELKYWKYKDSYKDFMGNDIYYYEKFVYLRGHQIECTEFFDDLHLERVLE